MSFKDVFVLQQKKSPDAFTDEVLFVLKVPALPGAEDMAADLRTEFHAEVIK
jgi:hypothetical protein